MLTTEQIPWINLPRDDGLILKRLRWQCRRGLLELDILLGNFLEMHYLHLSAQQQEMFVTLLSHTDQELLYWFTQQSVVPDELVEIITLINEK